MENLASQKNGTAEPSSQDDEFWDQVFVTQQDVNFLDF